MTHDRDAFNISQYVPCTISSITNRFNFNDQFSASQLSSGPLDIDYHIRRVRHSTDMRTNKRME